MKSLFSKRKDCDHNQGVANLPLSGYHELSTALSNCVYLLFLNPQEVLENKTTKVLRVTKALWKIKYSQFQL